MQWDAVEYLASGPRSPAKHGGTLKPYGETVFLEVGGLSDSGCLRTFTLGGEKPGKDVVAHSDARGSKGQPRPKRTPCGVLVRFANGGIPKIDEDKGPP